MQPNVFPGAMPWPPPAGPPAAGEVPGLPTTLPDPSTFTVEYSPTASVTLSREPGLIDRKDMGAWRTDAEERAAVAPPDTWAARTAVTDFVLGGHAGWRGREAAVRVAQRAGALGGRNDSKRMTRDTPLAERTARNIGTARRFALATVAGGLLVGAADVVYRYTPVVEWALPEQQRNSIRDHYEGIINSPWPILLGAFAAGSAISLRIWNSARVRGLRAQVREGVGEVRNEIMGAYNDWRDDRFGVNRTGDPSRAGDPFYREAGGYRESLTEAGDAIRNRGLPLRNRVGGAIGRLAVSGGRLLRDTPGATMRRVMRRRGS